MNRSIPLVITTSLIVTLTTAVWASSDEYDDDHEYSFFSRLFGHRHKAPPARYLDHKQYTLYAAECGDCHMAYPPNMLTQQSWQNMMETLDNHFGDNAELDLETQQSISQFLESNAAGPRSGEYSYKVWRSSQAVAQPDRITDTRYFRAKHHEIHPDMVLNNPDIGSFSRCDACHPNAVHADFEEHAVRIPGYGRWDD